MEACPSQYCWHLPVLKKVRVLLEASGGAETTEFGIQNDTDDHNSDEDIVSFVQAAISVHAMIIACMETMRLQRYHILQHRLYGDYTELRLLPNCLQHRSYGDYMDSSIHMELRLRLLRNFCSTATYGDCHFRSKLLRK